MVRRVDVGTSVEEDLRQRPFCTRQQRTATTDLYGLFLSGLCCYVKRSLFRIGRRLYVCASIEEDLRQRPFLTRQQSTALTDVYDFNLSVGCSLVKWRMSVPRLLLDVCSFIKQVLHSKLTDTGSRVDSPAPLRVRLLRFLRLHEVEYLLLWR